MNRAAWIAQQRGRKAVLYVVRVYTDGEAFYKVGVTYNVSSRWSRIKTFYRWRTIARYSSWDAGSIYDLEQRLHRGFAHLSYTPSSPFAGHTECYSDAAPILKALPRGTFFLKAATDI